MIAIIISFLLINYQISGVTFNNKLYYLKNDKWIELPREGKEWNATEMTMNYPPTKSLEENIKWSRKYGPLHKKGRYKLEQQGISINGIGGKYTIEFKIQ